MQKGGVIIFKKNKEKHKEIILKKEIKKGGEQEEKVKALKFSDINNAILINIAITIFIMVIAFTYMRIDTIIIGILLIIISTKIGKKVDKLNTDMEIWEALMWNLGQSISEIFKFKSKIKTTDILVKKSKAIKFFAVISFLFIASNNFVYFFSLTLLLFIYILAIAENKFEYILKGNNLIIISLLLGPVIKLIFNIVVWNVFYADLFSLGLVTLFVAIDNFVYQINDKK